MTNPLTIERTVHFGRYQHGQRVLRQGKEPRATPQQANLTITRLSLAFAERVACSSRLSNTRSSSFRVRILTGSTTQVAANIIHLHFMVGG